MYKIDNLPEYVAVFSGQNIKFTNKIFKGANLKAIFGGIDFDLQETEIRDKQVINASAIFGGIDIFVPDDVDIKVESISIFGGTENKISKKTAGKSTLIIKAFCLFGGIDIKPQNKAKSQ